MRSKAMNPAGGSVIVKGRCALRELALRRFAAMLRKLPGPAGEGMTLSPRRGGAAVARDGFISLGGIA